MIVIIVEGYRDGLMKIFTQSTENRTQSLVVGAYYVLDASLPPAPTYVPQRERGLVRWFWVLEKNSLRTNNMQVFPKLIPWGFLYSCFVAAPLTIWWNKGLRWWRRSRDRRWRRKRRGGNEKSHGLGAAYRLAPTSLLPPPLSQLGLLIPSNWRSFFRLWVAFFLWISKSHWNTTPQCEVTHGWSRSAASCNENTD